MSLRKFEHWQEIGFQSFEQYQFPTIVNLCVIRGACPCQCVHCPVGITAPALRAQKFGSAAMPLTLYEKIIKEISHYPHATLRIHGVGEPLSWTLLSDALAITSAYHVRNWLFTSLITNDLSLLKSIATHCDIIEVSVNSYTKNNYKVTKGVDAFAIVKQNIEYLRDYVQFSHLQTRLIVSRVESEDKAYDTDFVDHWKKSALVDDAFIRSYHNYNDVLDNKFDRQVREVIPCLVHWSRFNIDRDGAAVLCFNELFKGARPNPSLILGNTSISTIQEIWHSEKLNTVRRAQLQKEYASVNFTASLPCTSCFSCQPYGRAGQPTSEVQIAQLSESENDG